MITGQLDQLIEIMEVRYSGNTLGVSTPYYVPYRTVYASITGQRGNTGFDQGTTYTDNISFRMRYTTDNLKKGYVLKYQDELYSITNATAVFKDATIIDCVKVS